MLNEYDELLQGKPAAAGNVYDATLQDVAQRDSLNLRGAMTVASSTTPDRAAAVQKLSARTKLPPDIVERNFDTLSKKHDLNDNEYDTIVKENPRLTAYLSDPNNAKVSADDVGLLRRIENTFSSFGSGWKKAAEQGRLADLLFHEVEQGSLLPQDAAERDALKKRIQKLQESQQGGIPEYVAGVTGYSARQMVSSTEANLLGVGAGGIAGATVGSVVPGVGTVAGGTAGAIAGGLTASANYSYRLETGFAFDEFRSLRDINDNPIDPQVARQTARAVGVVNSLIETGSTALIATLVPGFNKLVGGLGGDQAKRAVMAEVKAALAVPTRRQMLLSALGKMGGAASIEGLEEFVQGLVGSGGGRELAQARSGQNFAPDSVVDDIAQASREALDAAVGTFFTFAPVGGASYYIDSRRAAKAQQQQKFFEALGTGVAESKTFQRLPEKMQAFIESATKDGPIDTVYMPVEQWVTYWQSQKLDPAVVASEVLGDTTLYESSLQSGTDLAIPMSIYATKIAPTEHNGFFSMEMRLAPDEMNAREAAEFETRLADEQKKTDEGNAPSPLDVSAAAVRDDVMGQLIASGYDRSTAETNAKAYEAWFRNMGERSGMDPFEIYKAKGLKINRPMPDILKKRVNADELDALLDRMRAGSIPTESSVYGKSLVELLREKGGVMDEGGELASRDADKNLKPFQRRLAVEGGMSLDTAREMAAQAGYIDQNSTVAEFLDLIDQELRGTPVYAMGSEKPQQAAIANAAEQLGRYISDLGLDLNSMTNEQVRAAMTNAAGIEIADATVMAQETLPEKLVIDGVERPTRNSNGQQIAATLEATEAFWRWFGDSKVVDDTGRPLVVFHGTDQDIAEFNAKGGTGKTFETGAFFTSNPHTASTYATGEAKNVMPLYLRIANPVVVDALGKNWNAVGQMAGVVLPDATVSDQADENLLAELEGRSAESGVTKKLKGKKTKVKELFDGEWDYADDTASTDDIARWTRRKGYEGLVINNVVDRGPSGMFDSREASNPSSIYVVFDPTQIKSATGNRGTFDPRSGNILHQSDVERDLIITHNVTAANVLHAMKMGGFPVPSLAITRAGESITGFGEITLIGSKEIADPRGYAGTKVFGADIYSPRYPTIEYKFKEAKLKALGREIAAGLKATAGSIDVDNMERRGREELANNAAVMWGFLKSRGIEPAVVMKEGVAPERIEALKAAGLEPYFPVNARASGLTPSSYYDKQSLARIPELQKLIINEWNSHFTGKEGRDLRKEYSKLDEGKRISWTHSQLHELEKIGEPVVADNSASKYKMREQIDAGLRTDFEVYVERLFESLDADESIFRGYTDSGRRRYMDHTLENVVKILKKEMVGGESETNIYGMGQLRSKFAPQFKSVAQIKAASGRLISDAEFDAVKKEVEAEFFALVDEMKHAYPERISEFGFPDIVMAVIEDTPKAGLDRAAKNNGFDPEMIDDDTRQNLHEFITRLRNMPTEYFEAKVLREVDLAEFAGAVVPEGTDPRVEEALRSRGLAIIHYPKGADAATRQKAVKSFAADLGDKVLFQDDKDKGNRGRIRFGRDRQFSIDLLEGADLSTFIHESGHFWLETLGDIVDELSRRDPATLEAKQIKMIDDYQKLLNWMGVKSRADIEVKHHEQFARGIEAYFMEGKAPSAELSSAFARVRAWMMSVYKSVKALNVTLNPEVREVFDRMFASDAQIEQAEAEGKVGGMFTDASSAGMTDVEFAAYTNRVEQASRTAKEQLGAKIMNTIKRERMKFWKAEREIMRAEVVKEINALPDQIALSFLTKGKMPDGTDAEVAAFKLSRKEIDSIYGDGAWRTLPRGSTAVDGIPLATAAEVLGFTSGDMLIRAVRGARPAKMLIEAETDARMRETHGDPLLDGNIADEARAAVHNEERAKVIQAELRALVKLQRQSAPAVAAERKAEAARTAEGQAVIEAAKPTEERSGVAKTKDGRRINWTAQVPTLASFQRIAAGRIGQMRVRDIRPLQYLTAARKASDAALKAAAAKDYVTAANNKQRELLNIELYRAATAAVEEVQETVDYMQKFGKAATRSRIAKAGQDYLDQIDGFLDRYEFAKVPLKSLDRRKALAAWVSEKERAGEPVNLPDDVVVEPRVNYKDVVIDELRGIRDSVKHIEHLARLKNKLLTAKNQRDLQVAIDEIVESIEVNAKSVKGRKIESRLPADEAMRLVDSAFAMHRKFSSLVREMDGLKDGGVLWEYVMRPINEAGDNEAVMNRAATEALKKIFDAYKGNEIAALYRKERIEEIGGSLTKMGRLMVALNQGNTDNRQKLMDGYGWNEVQVEAILSKLDERDWQFVQAVWDHIDSYWQQIEAKEKRINGIAPAKVEAIPVMTKFGELRGGYFPLKYDDRQSAQAHGDRIKEAADDMMKGAYTKATTRRGHTKERVEGVKLPVRLDFGVIFEHVGQVIHDVTHHETLIDVNRLLGSKAVSGKIIETYGDVVYKQLQASIQDIAAGNIPAVGAWEQSLNWVRSGMTIAGLGWNVMTSLLQPMGLSQSMARIGVKWVGQGLSRWIGDAARMENTATWIKEKSPMMRSRMDTQMREINEIRQQVGLNTGKFSGWVDQVMRTVSMDTVNKQAVVDSFFWLIYKGQQIADIPTWIGAYEKAMSDKTNNEARAVALADQAVLDSQGGGQMKDLSGIQRGTPLLKLWTSFYSYFNVTYNLNVEAIKGTNYRSPASIGRLAVDLLLLNTLPATLGFLMKEALTGSSDDGDEFLEKLIRENISYLFGLAIGLREFGSVIQGYQGYNGPAGARFFSSVSKMVKQVEQGEADAAFWRALNETAGILLHYPAGQVRRTTEGFAALMEGETSNPLALLVGPRKE